MLECRIIYRMLHSCQSSICLDIVLQAATVHQNDCSSCVRHGTASSSMIGSRTTVDHQSGVTPRVVTKSSASRQPGFPSSWSALRMKQGWSHLTLCSHSTYHVAISTISSIPRTTLGRIEIFLLKLVQLFAVWYAHSRCQFCEMR